MSIKSVFTDMILSGNKTVELRKSIPKIKSGDILVIYETAPKKLVTTLCEIDFVDIDSPDIIWEKYSQVVGIPFDEYSEYFSGRKTATAIGIKKVQRLNQPKKLSEISDSLLAPQSYRYIPADQFFKITK